ncbi:hypothetical protein JHK84_028182 [Glycine max]|nr:hypothetical protein JHK84_028182 [Glycine max]
MKKEAILINCSRGPVIDEAALVEHLKQNPMFRVGLDVFEEEPYMKPRLTELKNAIVVPHIASASNWTHEGMATLAALNVLGKIKGYPVWFDANRVEAFLKENARPPATCPSIVNAKALEPDWEKVIKSNKEGIDTVNDLDLPIISHTTNKSREISIFSRSFQQEIFCSFAKSISIYGAKYQENPKSNRSGNDIQLMILICSLL